MLTNPVFISICVMCALCLLRCNVMLAILIGTICAVLSSKIPLGDAINLFINGNPENAGSLGMGGNLETALSYLLLGVIASAISKTNLTAILVRAVANLISDKKYIFIFSIAFFACFSQNLIPVHIAFIPILIPPLVKIMNSLKIDRRAVACALTFGLQTPYMALPLGFGLIFMGLIEKNMNANGIAVSLSDISSVMWLSAVPMLVGLVLAVIYYRKPRDYAETKQSLDAHFSELKMGMREWGALAGIAVCFAVQIWIKSLPFAALSGILVMLASKGIEWKKLDNVFDEGVHMMGYIAFLMLIAAGYGTILKETGGVNELVHVASTLSGGKLGGALLMIGIGLLVTMGIGSSFGTIPIIATIYCPLAAQLGFSTAATIFIIGVAAGIGDAGSPASDSTLGPTVGLNIDGEHSHMWDTCVPTFIFFNIPLIIFGIVFSMML